MKKLLWLALLLPTIVFAQAELEPRVNANENSVIQQNARLDALEAQSGSTILHRIVVDDFTDKQIGVAQGSSFRLQFISSNNGSNKFIQKFGNSYSILSDDVSDVDTTELFLFRFDAFFDCNFELLGTIPRYLTFNSNFVNVPLQGSSDSQLVQTGALSSGDVVQQIKTTTTATTHSDIFNNVSTLDPDVTFIPIAINCIIPVFVGNAFGLSGEETQLIPVHTVVNRQAFTLSDMDSFPPIDNDTRLGYDAPLDLIIVYRPGFEAQAQAAIAQCETLQTLRPCSISEGAAEWLTQGESLPNVVTFTESFVQSSVTTHELVGNRGEPRTFSEDYR